MHFLLVSDTNWLPLSHRFQVIADYWSNFRCRHGVPISTTLVRGEPINLRRLNLAPRDEKHRSIVWCGKYLEILNRLGVDH